MWFGRVVIPLIVASERQADPELSDRQFELTQLGVLKAQVPGPGL